MLRMHFVLITTLSFLLATYCQAREGPCPIIPPVEKFNAAQYAQGRWFHLYHNYNDEMHFFDKLKCIEKSLSYDPDIGTVTVDHYGVCEVTNKPKWSKCYGYTTDIPGVFKMIVSNASLHYDSAEYRVVDTDYSSYSVGFVCGYNQKHNTHYISAGICARSQHLTTGNKLLTTLKFFKSHGINLNFVPTDWSDCRARCEYA